MFLSWSPMHISSFYQQLQLSPPASSSPKHPALCGYYPPPPHLATGDGFGRHTLDLDAHAAAAMTETDTRSPAAPAPLPKLDDGVERAVPARRDRHSKICTAGGMRDRRMRLSLDVARRFFALQDKLGFDKASKTVQWLLDMSTAGIKDLMMSDGGEQQIVVDFSGSASAAATKKKVADKTKALIKRAAASASRKSSASSSSSTTAIDKESRARARERARARTKERNRLRCAVLASSISVDEAPPSSRRPTAAMATHPEAAAGEVPSEHLTSSGYSYRRDQWELSGVVFGCSPERALRSHS